MTAQISPELFREIRHIQFKMQKLVADVFQGAYKSRFKGHGMEFEEVREYVPGDEVRTIDWNVTARMQTPYVKLFREERELTVMLLVDLSRSCFFGTSAKLKKEVIAEIGALLAFSAIKNQDKIGLILFSDRVELYVPPKKGVRHVLRLVREILARKPQGRKTDLKAALTYLGKVMSRSSICFLLSDFIALDFEKELRLTAQKHDLIGMRIYDAKEVVFPSFGLIEMTDLESGEKALIDTSSERVQRHFKEVAAQRAEEVKRLFNRIGVPLIEIDTSEGYLKPLEKYFKTRHPLR